MTRSRTFRTLCSPLPTDDSEKSVFQRTIHGTVSVLNSALKQPSVKHMAITASSAAEIPLAAYLAQDPGLVTPESKLPFQSLPKEYPDLYAAYAISKILAYNHTVDYIEEKSPNSRASTLCPLCSLQGTSLTQIQKQSTEAPTVLP
jgi:hypothetical protein